ncbi:MAG: acyl-CoA dehydrogenase [Hyphomonas sp.]|uniref:acyl-CoA dehydrogenase family protein n=1 Tax=Hyphomonas sp. TaxID=87 RepID=UPI0017B26E6F|nr:acyl-CoA dehydrogenase family protein [Hyphomonas sp.]MBU3920141.1 acyl-CoA dehydrogenase family protein [Alphaproteobacteria bacterium]MBA3067858.1 acyl-CoA dehydrogenase [Hyphomonas sp.]MBU4062414.1 acyl-CoA dehydrogenase family protein [Alphaproteobacteria bacterium]MBU4165977.1 acyl-CoA dehydrogenase family protein [Alphaproteobacteria bacterium]MBU4568614.1 acyl-CoA dehydrogenase family protein [Alphaproteobacteria bacterium]
MNLAFTRDEETFRDEVRAFLDKNLTADLRAYAKRMTSVYAAKPVALEWQRILVRQGWAAPAWPVEYGGAGWGVAERYIFDIEMARAGAPPLSPMGISMCGPALIGHGSKAQKDHYLPRILSGEDFWCQGYSEPHAGSDLAALTMSAVEDGDAYVCNGSKIWTTHAHEANMMFCLVRTDASGKPQQGITFLLIDMTAPGVRVDPILMLSGEHIQNAVFFSDVRVPKANVIGKVNEGWTVAKYLLEFERGGSSYGPRLLARLRSLRRIAAEENLLDADFARKLSRAEAEAQALEAAELQLMSDLSGGGTPGLKASMMKIKGTELSQHLTELALELAGTYAAPFQPHHTAPGGPVPGFEGANTPLVGPDSAVTASAKYLNDRAGSIYAGSNEIQRGILSKGQLGL